MTSPEQIRSKVRSVVYRALGLTPRLAPEPRAESNGSGRPRVAIGADHAGFPLKETLKDYLRELGQEVLDCGTHSTQSVDYPDFALAVAELVAQGRAGRGILVDGSGLGSCMAANKVPGVRAAMCYDQSTAVNSREHNDSNVLTLGAERIGPILAKQIVKTWLETSFAEGRDARRIEKIAEIESRFSRKGRPASGGRRISRTKGMETIHEPSLDRISEQITSPVRILLQEEPSSKDTPAPTPLSSHNPVDQVQPVPSAGTDRFAATPGVAPTGGRLAHLIDHTLLKPETSQDQIAQLCLEARKFRFASVCVNTTHVKLCAELLKGSGVPVCATIGFPLGATPTDVKVFEAQQAIRDGAAELDMVINIGALKSHDYDLVQRDIASVARACHASRALLKAIIETALLTDEEKAMACQLAKAAGADFVKTSTGFGPAGATPEDVALMRRVVGPSMGVKAAGGIRTYADVQKMIAAGATRIGASASVKIMEEAEKH